MFGGAGATINLNGTTNFAAGAKATVSHSATTAGLNVGPVAGDPSSLANGDVWTNSTTGATTLRTNGMNGHVGACKAWVNFNGVGNGTWAGGASTVSRTAGSTTATITTTTAHGLITGNVVWALTGVVAGAYAVTVLTATTFTITTGATTVLTAASITFAVNTIKASYNVSSITDVAVGTYFVNFSTPIVDTNYATIVTGSNWSDGTNAYLGYEGNPSNSIAAARKTTSTLVVTSSTAGPVDGASVNVAIFR